MAQPEEVEWGVFTFVNIPDDDLVKFFRDFFVPNLQEHSAPLGIQYADTPEFIFVVKPNQELEYLDQVYVRYKKQCPSLQVIFNIFPNNTTNDSPLYVRTKSASKLVKCASQGMTEISVRSRFRGTDLAVRFNQIATYLDESVKSLAHHNLPNLRMTATADSTSREEENEEVREIFRSQNPADVRMAAINALNSGQFPSDGVLELVTTQQDATAKYELQRSRHSSGHSNAAAAVERPYGTGHSYRTGSAPEPIGLRSPFTAAPRRYLPQFLVRKVPISATSDELHDLFQDYSVVHITQVMHNRTGPDQWGHVYVTVNEPEDVPRACADHNNRMTKLGGELCHIWVDPVIPKGEQQQFGSPQKYPTERHYRRESPPAGYHRSRFDEPIRPQPDRFQRASSVGRSLSRPESGRYERSRSVVREMPPEQNQHYQPRHYSDRQDVRSFSPPHYTAKRPRSPSSQRGYEVADNFGYQQQQRKTFAVAQRDRPYPVQLDHYRPNTYPRTQYYQQDSRRPPPPTYGGTSGYAVPQRDYEERPRVYRPSSQSLPSPSGPLPQSSKSPLHRSGYQQRQM